MFMTSYDTAGRSKLRKSCTLKAGGSCELRLDNLVQGTLCADGGGFAHKTSATVSINGAGHKTLKALQTASARAAMLVPKSSTERAAERSVTVTVRNVDSIASRGTLIFRKRSGVIVKQVEISLRARALKVVSLKKHEVGMIEYDAQSGGLLALEGLAVPRKNARALTLVSREIDPESNVLAIRSGTFIVVANSGVAAIRANLYLTDKTNRIVAGAVKKLAPRQTQTLTLKSFKTLRGASSLKTLVSATTAFVPPQ
jgi:hypothetical protein